jgi:fatty acid desaturase
VRGQTDVPHFTGSNWSYIKGAFMSIDRPYGPIFDFLHHRIGSTHVVHHIDCTIPHYRALAATKAVEKAFPEHYLYDPTPLPEALWRISTKCIAVEERDNKWVFVQGKGTPQLPA